MKIQLNGKDHTLDDSTTISQLLANMELADKRLAIELNQEIIPASQHEGTLLQENDRVEIVHAIGGG